MKMPDATEFPDGWNEPRVQRLLRHYTTQTETEAVAEDEAAWESTAQAEKKTRTGMTDIGKLRDALTNLAPARLFEQKYGVHALHREILRAYDHNLRIRRASTAYDCLQLRLTTLDRRVEDLRLRIGLNESALNSIRSAAESFTRLTNMEAHWGDLKLQSSMIGQLMHNQRRIAEFAARLDHLTRAKWLVSAPHNRAAEVLANISVLASVSESYQSTANCALANVRAYQRFADHQLARSLTDPTAVLSRRMRITDLAGHLLEDAQISWELMGSQVDVDPVSSHSQPGSPNIYSKLNQQLSYLYRDSTEEDPVDAFDRSTAATVSTAGKEIIDLVFNINEQAVMEGKVHMFTPTNRTLVSTAKITTTVADSRTNFSEVIDALYFVLYEGSGNANRLTDVMSREDLEPLWLLKKLRTFYRHDLDHGHRSKAKSQHIEIGGVFRQLIGRRPRRRAEWSAAQVSLYDLSARLLRRVLDAVESRG